MEMKWHPIEAGNMKGVPPPDKCFKCNHGKLQHDEFSDNWFECELLQRDVPPNGKPEDCPLDR